MKSEEFGHMMDKTAEEALHKNVTALCVSMASFIAEIDGSSADVAAYLEQRLKHILRNPSIRFLLLAALKDTNKLSKSKGDKP